MSQILKLMGVISICTIEHFKPNKQLVNAPTGLGRLNFARSSLRFTAPQQKRYESELIE